jgi:hypothetical protein
LDFCLKLLPSYHCCKQNPGQQKQTATAPPTHQTAYPPPPLVKFQAFTTATNKVSPLPLSLSRRNLAQQQHQAQPCLIAAESRTFQEQTPTGGANCDRARERERGLKRGLKRSALWWGKVRQGGGRNQRGKSGKERAPFTRGLQAGACREKD